MMRAWQALLCVLIGVAASVRVAGAQTCSESPRWSSGYLGPSERSGHAMTGDSARGRIVLFGGQDQWTFAVADTWEWDGTSWSRRATASAPLARYGHVMAFDSARQRTVLFGGTGFGWQQRDDTWEWDGTSWLRRISVSMPPSPRQAPGMAYDAARGRMVLFGGFAGSNIWLGDTWEWDGIDWLRRTPAAAPPARGGHAMAYDEVRQRVVLFGGSNGVEFKQDVWEWDGSTWLDRTPQDGSAMPTPRTGHGLAYDAALRRVVLVGAAGLTTMDAWSWDGVRWTRLRPGVRPPERMWSALAYDSSGQRLVSFGGAGAAGRMSDTWELRGERWTPRPAKATPPARQGHAQDWDAVRRRTVVFGGLSGSAPLGDTWEWDGVQWAVRSPAASPPARSGHALIYHGARQRIMVHGGRGSAGELADTWEWNGSVWSPLVLPAGALVPSARSSHAMAYDSDRQRAVLFGGVGPGGRLADTWELGTGSWSQRTTAGTGIGPSARGGHRMAYDAARRKVVLFGGSPDGLLSLADTWEWDGAGWTDRTPPVTVVGPQPRFNHTLTYDARRQRVVLLGGLVTLNSAIADAWEWDGTVWTRINSTGVPLARAGHSASFDMVAGQVVLFGGGAPGWGEFSDTWRMSSAGLNIRRPPPSRTVALGGYSDLSVVADGVAPLTYRWSRNGVPLDDSANVRNTSGELLQIRSFSTADVGRYTCSVTDACGVEVVSAPGYLNTCRGDFDADGVRTVADLFAFLVSWFEAEPRADIVPDTGSVVDDLFAFLSLWLAGC